MACSPVHRLRRFRLGRLVHLAHLVITVVALAGLLGQTMAQAAPLPLMDAASPTQAAPPMPDCEEMGAMASAANPDSTAPCENTPDCIARMGCAAVGPTLPRPARLNAPAQAMRLPIAPLVHNDRDGAGPSPLQHPPKIAA